MAFRFGVAVFPINRWGYMIKPQSLNRFPKLWIWHWNSNRKAVPLSVSVVQPIRLLQKYVPLFTSPSMVLDHVLHILRLHQQRE
ncbi:hypothetical protein PC122_g192 [Phytophthora cactorum]|nr:hypothetical protein PC122_g192 [Phytophthora cactorum]